MGGLKRDLSTQGPIDLKNKRPGDPQIYRKTRSPRERGLKEEPAYRRT